MCGIVGYVGNSSTVSVLLDGLKRLEYRGYDSSGIVIRNKDLKPKVIKQVGKIKELEIKLKELKDNVATSGIAHTRWATHGEATLINCHPHFSDDFNVYGVHNGILENYTELKDKLLRKGYTFYSDTDTEVLIKLIDYYYKKYNIGPIDAINKVMVRARGSYALALMFKDYPDEVWFLKNGSPLIVGKSDIGCHLASDIPAILNYTNKIYYVDDFECGRITKDSITFYDLNGDDITNKKELKEINWKIDEIKKGEYPYYMIKEILEQPKVILNCLNHYTKDFDIDLSNYGLTLDYLKNIENIYIFGCGSAYHVARVSEYLFDKLTNVNIVVDYSSEFKYRDYKLRNNSLAIVISQSGETKDTFSALEKCKSQNIDVLSIVNVFDSQISRNANFNLYTLAGPEIAVATTKAYSSQLLLMYLFILALAKAKNTLTINEVNNYIKELYELPDKISYMLENKESIQMLGNFLSSKKNVFFIGRCIDYAISEEGSLKFKEVTYIHSEAKPAGEMKHGTLSLVTDGVAVVIIQTQNKLLEKTISTISEINTRGGTCIVINMSDANFSGISAFEIKIPKTNELFSASLAIVELQLLSYYVSIDKGIDPDKPRNLAKSVTVE